MSEVALVKPFTSFEEQITLFKSKGLIISDEQIAREALRQIGYYRLSAYTLTLKTNDRFYKGITFENILDLYFFDKELRFLILRYTEPIEISIKTAISHYHAGKYTPLGYLARTNFLNDYYHDKFIDEFEKEISRSKELFIVHHFEKYQGNMPIWVSMQVISFGCMSKFYSNLIDDDKKVIANQYYNYSYKYIMNWLEHFSVIRNIAAHRCRFYNRPIRHAVKLSRKHYSMIDKNKVFASIIAMKKILPNQEQKKELINDLVNLFEKYPFALPKHIGCPENWKEIIEQA